MKQTMSTLSTSHSNALTDRQWPLEPHDVSPLAWWRWLPSHMLRDAEALLIDAALERTVVLHRFRHLDAALRGEAPAAISAAFYYLPIEKLTLEADITMTALLRCALKGNSASALGLANIIGRTDLGHPFAAGLAASWNAKHSPHRARFSVEEAALTEAISHCLEGEATGSRA